MNLDEDVAYLIYSIVNEIPVGYVTTYGAIAHMIGRDKNSRLCMEIFHVIALLIIKGE